MECLTPNRSSAHNGYVKLNILFTLDFACFLAPGVRLTRRLCYPLRGKENLFFLAEPVNWHPIVPDSAMIFLGFGSTFLITRMSTNTPVESTCRVQNTDIPWAGRVGAHGGVAGRGRAGLSANRTVRLGNNPSSHFQSIEDTAPERFPRSTNKRNPI